MASNVWGELVLSSLTCQLREHLPKQVTNTSMVPNTNETPNYFRVSIPHWHRRFLRGLTSCASMPNADSNLRRNRWTEVPTGWRDGMAKGEGVEWKWDKAWVEKRPGFSVKGGDVQWVICRHGETSAELHQVLGDLLHRLYCQGLLQKETVSKLV